jgi:tRNA dimethylallyltransferase
MIVILGPTASGKTTLAAHAAFEFNGEIISADSRQVYRGMDIGTGKDLDDYMIQGTPVPYHLIDIADPGYEYNLFEFQHDFRKVYDEITSRNKLPILCGGTGLYIEAVLREYQLPVAEKDPESEGNLRAKSMEELTEILLRLRPLHNTTDTTDKERLIRAILIASPHPLLPSQSDSPHPPAPSPEGEGENAAGFGNSFVFGVRFERDILRNRITDRLEKRLQSGLIREVQKLLNMGLRPDQLKFYGLEYKFVTLYLQKELTYDEMFSLLNTAIRQYSKRQMTWFRKMERSGIKIHWIDGELETEKKVDAMKIIIRQGENV